MKDCFDLYLWCRHSIPEVATILLVALASFPQDGWIVRHTMNFFQSYLSIGNRSKTNEVTHIG